MGAFISLAFGWKGLLKDYIVLDQALRQAGLHPIRINQSVQEMHESVWRFSFKDKNLFITCRCYQEEEWVATTLDIDETLFETVGSQYGREKLVQAVVNVGVELLKQLHLRYVFFDEEVEADIKPDQYHANNLYGITIIADDVPGLDDACQRSDVQRVEKFKGGIILFRRLDPVPHYHLE